MSRWSKLFGTPTDAARTIVEKDLLYDLLDRCDGCPKYTEECLNVGSICQMESFEAMLEWLEGEDA